MVLTYTEQDFSGQTISLAEQTRFVRCDLTGATLRPNGYGWELLDCANLDMTVEN